jgi:hypothetical protein
MNILIFLWNFLKLHWSDILVVVVFVVAMVVLWKRGNKRLVKRVLRGLVIKAEKQLGSKTGPLKKEVVYDMLPWILKIILTREDFDDMVKDAVEWLKKQLADNPGMTLMSYDDEALNAALKGSDTDE